MVKLIKSNTFYKNYGEKINKIRPSSCWRNEHITDPSKCNVSATSAFFDGLESTQRYVEKMFPYDENTRTVRISDKEVVSIDSIPMIPDGECKQVVLGTFELIAVYFYYNKLIANKFIVLAAENWTESLNAHYVSCAFARFLKNQTCEYPIRLLLPNHSEQLLRSNKTPRATLFELCIILSKSGLYDAYRVEDLEAHSYTTYFMKPMSNIGGKIKKKTRRSTHHRKTKKQHRA